MSIELNKMYTLDEVVKLGVIPNATSHSGMYNLVTEKKASNSNKLGWKRVLAEITTSTSIKAVHGGQPWNKISGKIRVEGKEIVKFLEFIKLYNNK